MEVEGHRFHSRQLRRAERLQRPDPAEGEPESDDRAERGDHERFREELADDPSAAGAERRAHRHLARARRASPEQQIGDVHAGEQEQQRGCGEDDEQRRPEIADDLRDERTRDEGAAGVGRREVARQAAHHDRQFVVQPLDRHAGLEAEDRVVAVIDVLPVVAQVEPEVGAVRQIDLRRGHAGDRRLELGEAHGLADDLAVAAEDFRPDAVRDNDTRRRPLTLVLSLGLCRDVLLVREAAAERHRQAEHLEKPFADAVKRGVHGRRIGAQERRVERAHGDVGRARDGRGGVGQSKHLRRREQTGGDAAVRIRRVQRDELLRVCERQRPQQRRVDRAEDGGRRTDPDGQRGDRRERECRRRRQLAYRVAEVLRQSVHHLPPGKGSGNYI